MGCQNCGIISPGKETDLQLEEIRKQAKDYATEKKEPVIIYWDPVEGWKFILESASAGIPARELISIY